MMRGGRTYRSEGIVLRSMALGEADLLMTLYTKETGKLRAMARGVRKPTSRLVGHLEPLTRIELALARGRGLDVVTQAQVLESFSDLKDHLTSVSSGLYLAELVDGFGAEGSANPELYFLLIEALRSLEEGPGLELVLRYFELHLLKSSGFSPELYHCVKCRRLIVEGEHLFSPDLGGTLCSQCIPTDVLIRPLSIQALKVLRFFDRSGLPDLDRLHVDKSLAEELKGLLAAAVRYWLDREIRSKSFLEHLQHAERTGV